jgi:D-tyrosyl-tRNA(Tyr) deacylase
MRAVVQRITRARVTVAEEIVGEIGTGLVVLLGVAADDTQTDVDYLADKIAALRIFEDDAGKMNLSVKDIAGGVLAVSQFTLYGDVRRGLRPSFSDAARPELADRLYQLFVSALEARVAKVATGSFRRLMQVELVNDGPVTILLDSKKLF